LRTTARKQAEGRRYLFIQIPTADDSLIYASAFAERPLKAILPPLARSLETPQRSGDAISPWKRFSARGWNVAADSKRRTGWMEGRTAGGRQQGWLATTVLRPKQRLRDR